MARKNINTTIDEDLYFKIKMIALKNQLNANDLIEEGMQLIIKKYQDKTKTTS